MRRFMACLSLRRILLEPIRGLRRRQVGFGGGGLGRFLLREILQDFGPYVQKNTGLASTIMKTPNKNEIMINDEEQSCRCYLLPNKEEDFVMNTNEHDPSCDILMHCVA